MTKDMQCLNRVAGQVIDLLQDYRHDAVTYDELAGALLMAAAVIGEDMSAFTIESAACRVVDDRGGWGGAAERLATWMAEQ